MVHVGGGDKLQGLAPNATGFFIPSGKGGVNYYRTQEPNGHLCRDFVFCMNQLGGVGANKSQQKIRGLSSNVGWSKTMCASSVAPSHGYER